MISVYNAHRDVIFTKAFHLAGKKFIGSYGPGVPIINVSAEKKEIHLMEQGGIHNAFQTVKGGFPENPLQLG